MIGSDSNPEEECRIAGRRGAVGVVYGTDIVDDARGTDTVSDVYGGALSTKG